MRVMTLIAALVMAIPAAAAAQDQGNTAATSGAATTEATAAKAGLAAPAAAPTTLQGTSSRGTRRKGSMVGYIDDAIIASKVRVRFDAGLHDTVPDRAEFFYAKCGCYADAGADPNSPGPRPGSAKDLTFQQLTMWGEYAVNDRFSVFAHAPIRWPPR